MTDEYPAYKSLDTIVNRHEVVNHKAEEWVRGDVQHKRYLSEFDYRFNNRTNDGIFDLTVSRLCQKPGMPYRELTGKASSEPF